MVPDERWRLRHSRQPCQNATYVPAQVGTLVFFTAADIDAALLRVTERGGKVLRAKTSIGEHGFIGHSEDSEGNRVALHSRNGR